jgi:eukaryotic-like serine/threonine-protein kinase
MNSRGSTGSVFLVALLTSVITTVGTILLMHSNGWVFKFVAEEQEMPSLVPDLAGRTKTDAILAVEALGFTLQMGEPVHHDSIPKGSIADQIPLAGSPHIKGRSVVARLSTGPEGLPVPKVIHMSLAKAKRLLQKAGFKVGNQRWDYDEDLGPFAVLAQDPKPDTRAPPGTAINLVVNED